MTISGTKQCEVDLLTIEQCAEWEPCEALTGQVVTGILYFPKHDIALCLRVYLGVFSSVNRLQPGWGVHILKALISQAPEPAASRQALLLHTLLSSHSWGDKAT